MNADQSSNLHHRRSIRLKDFDYSSEGSYFVTIVAHDRESLFGSILNDEIQLSSQGHIVWDIWNSLQNRYPQIELDCAIVMPNHFHAIISIVGVIHELPLRKYELPMQNEIPLPTDRIPRRKMLLPLVVGYFKMNTAKRINTFRGTPGVPVWQRNYYEHIIDSDKEYEQISAYIFSNPLNWKNDSENL